MENIIDLKQARENRKHLLESDDLNILIKKADLICKEKMNFFQDEISVVRDDQLKNVFEREIVQEIFSRKLISSDVFLCGMYISNMMTELMLNIPESWWAIDYVDFNDFLTLKKGGDVCFIICGIFPERGNYRSMDISYYKKMGKSFYYQIL